MENIWKTISDYLEEVYNGGILQFKFNGKLLEAYVVNVDGKDVLKIDYTPSDIPKDSTLISWLFKNYRRYKNLVVDLSQSRTAIKEQVMNWLNSETFD